MTETIWLITAAVTALLSMGWLALAYETHWQQVFPASKTLPNSKRLKTTGWFFLLLSALCCLRADHPTMAVLVWVMLLAVTAFTVAMILSRRPVLLKTICPPLFAAKV
ncbi:DUF3325 domain-containing protein [Methylophaga sp. OBS1]|uniref:DUF3325 domain-containing protein n=1 Tax=Methylophaga sp. OBS1 TaxID=2991933 RepID=UPI0022546BE6|nr:DUF3325 domain-containing protein [Methylophaga sp. OBS1]MCX4192552.1 DUF3325 domain-containing protein [Methylophaga sp. OBS1]